MRRPNGQVWMRSFRGVRPLMCEPVGKTSSLVQEFTRPLVRTVVTVVATAVLSLSAWFVVFSSIQSVSWLGGSLFEVASLRFSRCSRSWACFSPSRLNCRRIGLREDEWGACGKRRG